MYPGDDLPPISRFVFERPDGWELSNLGFPLATLRPGPDSPTSMTISVSRVARSFDLNTLIQSTRTDLRRLDPDARIGIQKIGRMNGQVAMLRIAEFTPPSAPSRNGDEPNEDPDRISIHVAFFGPAGPESKSVELFQLAGTTTTDNRDDAQMIMETINSFRFLGVPTSLVAEAFEDSEPVGADQ
jgi:hypothetical protein